MSVRPSRGNRGRTLVLDARWLMTGIGRYTMNLLRELKPMDGSIHLRTITTAQHAATVSPFSDQVRVVNAPIYTVREQFVMPLAARSSDLLHVPHYNAPLLHRGPLLVTISDLTHILDTQFRRTLKSRLYAQPMLRIVAARADHIFTVSEYSKQRIIEYLRVAPAKVTVVHNGVAPEFHQLDHASARQQTCSSFGIDGPYLLYVGNLKPHKNVPGLLRALALLRAGNKLEHKLLIIGGDGLGRAAVERLARDLGLGDDVVVRWSVPEDSMAKAYCGADLLILPSFEEGFGLPVLESMACGTPVACSRAASLPEVADGAASYFDPHIEADIAEAIVCVLESSEMQQLLRARGLARAARFTRQQSARLHHAVYREFLN